MTALDEALNWIMPLLIFLVAISFLWLKTPLGAWLGPHIKTFWLWAKGESEEDSASSITSREIIYE